MFQRWANASPTPEQSEPQAQNSNKGKEGAFAEVSNQSVNMDISESWDTSNQQTAKESWDEPQKKLDGSQVQPKDDQVF